MNHRLRVWILALTAALLCVTVTATGASAQETGDQTVPYQQLANVQPDRPIQPATTSVDAGFGALRTRLGDIRLDPNVTLTGVTLTFAGGKVGFSGGLRIKCAAGGAITLFAAGDLSFVRSGTWSLTAGASTGAGGCFLIPELGLGDDMRATISLRSVGGKITAEVHVDATVKTTLIPTQSEFAVGLDIVAGRGDLSMSASGRAAGASFSGALSTDGTFELAFSLDELTINRVKLGAKGRVARTTPGGRLEVSVSGGIDGEFQLIPGLNLLRGTISFDNNQIVLRGAVRLRCETGWLEAGIDGTLTAPDTFSVRAYAAGEPCVFRNSLTLVDVLTLESNTFEGTITGSRSGITFDATVGVAELDLGEFRVPAGDRVRLGIDRTTVRLTNACAGCQADRIRIILNTTAWARVTSAGLPGPAELRLDLAMLLDIEVPTFFPRLAQFVINNVRVNGVPTGLAVLLRGELQRRIEQLFDTALGRASGTGGRCAVVTCTNAVSAQRALTSGAGSARDTVTATSKARIRSVKVRRSSGSRLRVSVRTSVPATRVNVEMQRRRCLFKRCRWALAAYRQVVTNSRGIAVVRSKARMKRGRYRVLVRLGSNRKSRAVIRRSKIR